MSLFRRLDAAVGRLAGAAASLAAAACLGAFALVCFQVIMRYFANRPQAWADEVAGWLIVATVMLAAPEAQARGENIGVDAVIERAQGPVRRGLLLLGLGAVAATAWIILDEGIEMVAFSRMVGIASNVNPEMPLWAVQALVPVGGGLLLAIALWQIVALFAGREPGRPQGPDAGRHE